MGIETADDADIFFDVQVFGEVFGWALAAGGGDDVNGIWSDEHTIAAAGDFSGVSTVAPMIKTSPDLLPAGAGVEDTVTREASGFLYRVADIQPDGTGHVAVILERIN